MNFRSMTTMAVYGCLIALTAGCTVVDQKVGLSYIRPDLYQNRHGGDIAVLRPIPPAASRNAAGDWIIGSLNNVHGVHQADLLSDRSTVDWIADALVYELRQAGYQAAYQDAIPRGIVRGLAISDVKTGITVNRGAVTSDARFELRFNVEAYVDGDRIKTFTISSHDERTVPFSASREELEGLLLQSLQEAMRRLIPDIITLIDKK